MQAAHAFSFSGRAFNRLIRNLLLATLLLAASLSAAEEFLPIQYFTRQDDFGTMEISPNGKFLAATTGGSDVSALVFMKLADMQLVGGVRARENDEITGFDWVSDTRVIYYYGERYPGHAYTTETGEIFAVDRDGGNMERLYGYRAGKRRFGVRLGQRKPSYASGELLSALEEDDEHILILERPWQVRRSSLRFNADAHPRIALLQVYDGHKKSLGSVPLALADVVVDRNEQVRFAVDYDEDATLAVIWRPTPAAEWTKFELPGFREQSVIPRRFTTDDRGVLFTGVKEGESIEALYRLDLQTTTVERLYRHDEADINSVVMDLTGETVIGVRVYADKLEYHWLNDDDPAVRVYKLLQSAFPGQSVQLTSVSRDGRLAVGFVYSDINPGDFYLFDIESRKATYLQATRSWVDPELMRPKEPVVVEARDGLHLHGYLTRPRDGAGPYPLIVLPHGGPLGVRDYWNFDWEVQLLANRGYAVLQVNFRGSSGYGVDFADAGYGEWGALMQDDLTDATRWAIREGITEADSICIFGSSYGGYAALMGLVREPDLYRCAIGHAGVYDLELMFEEGDTQRWDIGEALLEKSLGDDPELLRKRSPVHNAELIRAPVLLIHGKDDWRADFEHAVRMKEALEKAGNPVEWLPLADEGHGVYNEETREAVYGRILAFLDRHLPLDSAGEAQASAD